MAKIFHYHSQFSGNILHQMTDDFGESNTDKSFYTPSAVTARATLGAGSPPNRILLYDFEDGKDTGETLQTLLRSKGLDITEIDRIGEILQQQVDADKDYNAQQVIDAARKLEGKQLNDYLKTITETLTASASSPNNQS